MAIKITRKVHEGIEEVRKSGKTNMLDREAVRRLCDQMGHTESAMWIEHHHKEYAEAIFAGFEVVEEWEL